MYLTMVVEIIEITAKMIVYLWIIVINNNTSE